MTATFSDRYPSIEVRPTGLRALALALGLVCAPAVFGPGTAHAQLEVADDTGFSLERFVPPAGNTPFLALDHADVLPHLTYSGSASLSLMSRPLVLRDIFDDELATVPVATRMGLDMSAALGLGSRFQVSLGVPLVLYQSGDRLRDIGLDETELSPFALGDMRLAAKARFVGKPGERGPAVAAALRFTLPTGNQEHFAGERGTVIAFHILGSYRNRWLSAGLDLAARLRTSEVVLLSPARPHGNELTATLGAALDVPLSPQYATSIIAELALVRGDSGSGSARGPSPGEARLGGRLGLCTGWSANLGVGAGITPGDVGSPAWRLIAGVRYDRAPIADADHDNIEDGRDQCRGQAEDRDGFEDADGCPDNDNDNDGYPDFADDCPNEAEDYDGHRDVDGCPDLQRTFTPVP